MPDFRTTQSATSTSMTNVDVSLECLALICFGASRVAMSAPGGASDLFYRGTVRSNMQPQHIPPNFDITVRVGCSLVYEVTGTASLLLNLKLHPDRNHALLFEALALGNNLPVEDFVDSHGNHVCRVALAHGTNCFRHDAIVAVPSQPDNHGLVPTSPQLPGDLPAALLRYTLPSRYCDSDKLTDFAWQQFGQIEHGMPRVEAISRWLHREH